MQKKSDILANLKKTHFLALTNLGVLVRLAFVAVEPGLIIVHSGCDVMSGVNCKLKDVVMF